MRVLHVIAGMRNSSGPTHVAANLTSSLARKGCKVNLYHLIYGSMDPLRPLDERVEVRAFPRSLSRTWGYSRSMGKALEETVGSLDLVHVHGAWQYPTYAACRACRNHGVPYVFRPAGAFEPWCLRQGALKKALYSALIERRNLAQAALVHAASQQEAENLSNLGITTRISVVPNGIDEEYFNGPGSGRSFRSQYGLDDSTPLVLFLSRLHPKKGLDILIRSFALVRERVPRAVLIIAGRAAPGYGERVRRMIRRGGIERDALLTGELRGRQKLAAFRAADVFALPSRSENFGIVVAEAMACGTPVVVSRETPWQAVEEAGSGRWVSLEPAEFARHMVEVLTRPRLRHEMGQNGRELVRRCYTWDRIADRILELYEDVLQTHRG